LTTLINTTRPLDIFDLPRWEGARYHAIYETGDGKDYCRETLHAKSHESAIKHAQLTFDRTADSYARKAVVSFRIECF
jgi:hypothetical protein